MDPWSRQREEATRSTAELRLVVDAVEVPTCRGWQRDQATRNTTELVIAADAVEVPKCPTGETTEGGGDRAPPRWATRDHRGGSPCVPQSFWGDDVPGPFPAGTPGLLT